MESTGLGLSALCFNIFGKTVGRRYIFNACFVEALFITWSPWKSQQLVDSCVRHNWFSQVYTSFSELIVREQQTTVFFNAVTVIILFSPELQPMSPVSHLSQKCSKQRTKVQQLTVKSCFRPHFINSELHRILFFLIVQKIHRQLRCISM